MSPYLLPFIVFITLYYCISYVGIYSSTNIKRLQPDITITMLIGMCLFAGLRWSKYTLFDFEIFDYATYKEIFEDNISIFNFKSDIENASLSVKTTEPGYTLYSLIIKNIIGSNYNIFLLFTNSLLVFLFYKSLKENKINNGLIIIIFIYVARLYLQYNFVLLRQAIAMMIIWRWSFPYILKKDNKKFLGATLIACLFHITAIIALLSPLFLRKYQSKKILLLIIFSALLSLTSIIDNIIIGVISSILPLIGFGGVSDKLGSYILMSSLGSRGLNLINFVEVLPFAYIAYRYRHHINENIHLRFYSNMLLFYILFLALTMNFSFLTRMSQYFIFSFFYLLSFYIKNAKSSFNKQIYLTTLTSYFFIYALRYCLIWHNNDNYSCWLLNI